MALTTSLWPQPRRSHSKASWTCTRKSTNSSSSRGQSNSRWTDPEWTMLLYWNKIRIANISTREDLSHYYLLLLISHSMKAGKTPSSKCLDGKSAHTKHKITTNNKNGKFPKQNSRFKRPESYYEEEYPPRRPDHLYTEVVILRVRMSTTGGPIRSQRGTRGRSRNNARDARSCSLQGW